VPAVAAVPIVAAPMAAAASANQGTTYLYTPAWSKYASSKGNGEFAPRRGGVPLPAVRSMASPTPAPMPVAAAPMPVAAAPTTEDAAKAAWLAKQDVTEWGTQAGTVPAVAAAPTAAVASSQRTSSAGQGANYQYTPAWSKYASSKGNGEFAPRRGQ